MPTTTSTPTVIDGLITQLVISHRSLHRNIDGVTHDESLKRPEAGANCINWMIGHLAGARNGILAAIGGAPVVPKERFAAYARGSDGALEQPMRFEELVEIFDKTQEPLIAGLRRLTDEQLNAKSPLRSPAGENATFAEALAAMTLHECYHVGQLGMARRLVGKKGAI